MHAPASARARLRDNGAGYARLRRVVEAHADRGDVERVLRSATMAANSAWRAPVGFLADPALERLVAGTVQGGGAPASVDGGRSLGRVLHVLTEGYRLGGHTRLAWRWMERDPRRSDLALTHQRGPVPPSLADAVAASGGEVFDLATAAVPLSARAAALRDRMDQADVVVLHVHPYDAVALAAASLPGPRPPIILENHADHAFWLGLGCADVVMDHRTAAQQVSHELRGVRPERLGLLPLPIDDEPSAPADREAVRRTLGLRPGDVAAVSVANPEKMAPLWGQGFEQLLTRALLAHPRLKVFLVGPPAEGAWAALAARFQKRLHPLGPREDVAALLPAMDLYLDSYPVSSGTSILEAAVAGLAPLSLLQHEGHRAVYHANSPGLVGAGHVTTTEADYLTELGALVADADVRVRRGATARASVLDVHTGPAWNTALEALYAQARSVPIADLGEYPAAIQDLSYGAFLVPFLQGSGPGPDVMAHGAPLGPLFDAGLRNDVFAAAHRDSGRPLSIRVTAGWEDQPDGTMRLLRLAERRARLSVSLPFVAGDDAHATRSVQQLSALLAAVGQTVDTCGDISLDATDPVRSAPRVDQPLPLTPEVLDQLEDLVGSPCWEAPRSTEPHLVAATR